MRNVIIWRPRTKDRRRVDRPGRLTGSEPRTGTSSIGQKRIEDRRLVDRPEVGEANQGQALVNWPGKAANRGQAPCRLVSEPRTGILSSDKSVRKRTEALVDRPRRTEESEPRTGASSIGQETWHEANRNRGKAPRRSARSEPRTGASSIGQNVRRHAHTSNHRGRGRRAPVVPVDTAGERRRHR